MKLFLRYLLIGGLVDDGARGLTGETTERAALHHVSLFFATMIGDTKGATSVDMTEHL